MVSITFKTTDNQLHTVEAKIGQSVMGAAVSHRIAGIEAICGGSLVCGTCHAFVQEPWFSGLPPRDEMEEMMLENGVHVQENSRLTCQVAVSEELEGAIFVIPPSQV